MGLLHELESTVQHLCTSIPCLWNQGGQHFLCLLPSRYCGLWAHKCPAVRTVVQAQWCVLGKPTWERSQQDCCSRAYSYSHVETSSLSQSLFSPLPRRKYHELLMQRAAGSSLLDLFTSTEHTPVVCLVFSITLCPSFLCISSSLGVMV